jgi:hypothetical protein
VSLVGCSRVPPGAVQGVAAGVDPLTGQPTTSAPLPGGSAAPGLPGASGQPGTTTGVPGAPGSGAGPGAGSGGGGGDALGNAPGVNGRTVNIVIHTKLQDCGPDPNSSRTGTANAKGLQMIQDYVGFFNKYVLGPYNWKLAYKVIDDGGQFCAEKARAAGLQIAKQLKPFAALGDSANGDEGPVLADVVTRAHIVDIGLSWNTTAMLRERHPYAWPIFGFAEQQDRDLVEFVGKRVKGTKTADLTTGQATDRVYGMITADNPESRQLAAMMKSNLAAQGVTLSHTYFVSSDAGVAAQAADNTVLKMKSDGVNTLIFAIPYTSIYSAIVYTNAMDHQNYLPDLLGSRYGVVFFDRLFSPRVWAKMRGVFQCGISCVRASGTDTAFQDVSENDGTYKKVWAFLGHTDDPDNGITPSSYNIYTNLAQLAIGIVNAGPVLNAQTFAAGIDASAPGHPAECLGWRLMGRPYTYEPYAAGWSSAHTTGIIGFTPAYWVNQKNEFGTVGYYESYDNYRYFRGGDLPVKPTRDTGTAGPAVPKQKPIGLKAWVSCTKLGMKD